MGVKCSMEYSDLSTSLCEEELSSNGIVGSLYDTLDFVTIQGSPLGPFKSNNYNSFDEQPGLIKIL